jgi:hypothetical protein
MKWRANVEIINCPIIVHALKFPENIVLKKQASQNRRK